MREVKVPDGQQVVLFKDRSRFPGEELTKDRAIVIGRLTIDRRLIGWQVSSVVKALQPQT